MREPVNFNTGWQFVSGKDGQDGGNDCFRGECVYRKAFLKKELPTSQEYFLEINGANSVARVLLPG